MYIFLVLVSLINFSYPGKLEVKDAWLRPGGKGMNTALYFKVENKSDKPDTLLSVKSSIADVVQTHETYKKGDMMGMRKVNAIAIEPNSTFELKPGGFHVMVIGLKEALRKNDSAKFTLHFKNAGDINVKAPVKMEGN
ncbi:MAG: copper chaperone PCu(A)C [Melioribacteraceae bacterium]